MEWSSLIAPAVVAAVVSGVVTLVGSWINRGTSLRLHDDRVRTDRELAQVRMAADHELAKTRAKLDLQLVDWKRRAEFAEELLSDFYKARDIFRSARNAFAFSGEGETRAGREDEPEDERRRKDSIYAPLERLNRERDFLSSLHAKRFRAEALFGSDIVEPFLTFMRAYNDVAFATEELMEGFGGGHLDRESKKKLEQEIGWTRSTDDPIQPQLDAAVAALERICRPVIEGRPSLEELN